MDRWLALWNNLNDRKGEKKNGIPLNILAKRLGKEF
jgi:hypothetical protein